MTGAGPLEGAVRRRAAGLSEDSFTFLGVVDDVGAHLASLDVLVLPSILDGRPVVVLEALASGVPVIASRVGGLLRSSMTVRPDSWSSPVTRARSPTI